MKKTILTSLIMMSSALTWADADSIYFGGNILTMSDAQPNAQAVAVKDGKIVAVGDLAEIKAEHKVTDTQLIDLNGRTLMPGFIDAHSHLFLSSMKKATVNMDPAPAGNVRSIKDIQRSFSERLAEREEGNLKSQYSISKDAREPRGRECCACSFRNGRIGIARSSQPTTFQGNTRVLRELLPFSRQYQ